jgi:DNA-binding transcriptional ArsR family regulator
MERERDGPDLLSESDSWELGDDVAPRPSQLFKALAGPRRCHVLAILLDRPNISVDELTDIIVGWQTTIDGPSGPDEWAQVKIELVHAHLPLLDDMGLVAFDDREGEVQLQSLADPVEHAIRFAEQYERALDRSGRQTE